MIASTGAATTLWRDDLSEVLDVLTLSQDLLNRAKERGELSVESHVVESETPKCCYGWPMKPSCIEGCPHATEEAKKMLMHRLSYPSVAPSATATTTDQECWLIERFVNDRTEFWAGWNDDAYGLGAGPSSKWTHDAFEAVRFSRKEDADAVMLGQGGRFHLAKSVAHLWVTRP